MKERLITPIAILLLASLTFACSVLPLRKSLSWHLTLELGANVPDREAATLQAVTVLKARLDALALANAQVEATGTPPNGRIRVSLPNVPDRERLKKLLTAQGRLELAHVISPPSPAPFQLYETKEAAMTSLAEPSPTRRVLPYSESPEAANRRFEGDAKQKQKRWMVVESPAIIDGSDLRDASAIQGMSDPDDYSIHFSIKPSGAAKFASWTGSHINEYLAVVFNDEVKSVAYIKSQIADSGEITGRFTKQAAEDVALILRSGALPEVTIVEEGAGK